jgi:hypothetical protein
MSAFVNVLSSAMIPLLAAQFFEGQLAARAAHQILDRDFASLEQRRPPLAEHLVDERGRLPLEELDRMSCSRDRPLADARVPASGSSMSRPMSRNVLGMGDRRSASFQWIGGAMNSTFVPVSFAPSRSHA